MSDEIKLTTIQAKLIESICLRYGIIHGLDDEEKEACICLAKQLEEEPGMLAKSQSMCADCQKDLGDDSYLTPQGCFVCASCYKGENE